MNGHWLDKPQNIRSIWRAFLVLLALIVIAGFMVDLHPHFDFERWSGFNAAYGFFSCVLMIVIAKILGLWLKRPDDYYNHNDGSCAEEAQR